VRKGVVIVLHATADLDRPLLKRDARAFVAISAGYNMYGVVFVVVFQIIVTRTQEMGGAHTEQFAPSPNCALTRHSREFSLE
jgi:hypothetical protein